MCGEGSEGDGAPGTPSFGSKIPHTAHHPSQQLLLEVIIEGQIFATEVEVILNSDGFVNIVTVDNRAIAA